MSKWYTISCVDCGTEIHVHEDWDNPPKFCQSCKAEHAAQWYEKSCAECGTTLRVPRDWDNPPKYFQSCKARRAAQWYEKSCADCGTTIRVHRGWDNPPKFCQSCKARRAAQWYEKSCAECGTTMRVHQDWDNPPKFCHSCKAKHASRMNFKSKKNLRSRTEKDSFLVERLFGDSHYKTTISDGNRTWTGRGKKPEESQKIASEKKRAAQWYEKSCADCDTTMRVHRDWDNPPKFCQSCKAKRATQ